MIKAKRLNMEMKEKIDEVQSKVFCEETFYGEMIQKFSTQEISKLKFGKLDKYCLFIASRYLNTLEDHINFVKTCKRMEKYVEKFHYNPFHSIGLQ